MSPRPHARVGIPSSGLLCWHPARRPRSGPALLCPRLLGRAAAPPASLPPCRSLCRAGRAAQLCSRSADLGAWLLPAPEPRPSPVTSRLLPVIALMTARALRLSQADGFLQRPDGKRGTGRRRCAPAPPCPVVERQCRSRHAGSPCCPRMCAPKARCSRPAPVGAVPILLLAPAARCTQGCERCSLPQLARFGSFHLSYHSWDGKGQSPAPGCITVAIPPLSRRTGWLGRAAASSPRAAIVFPA